MWHLLSEAHGAVADLPRADQRVQVRQPLPHRLIVLNRHHRPRRVRLLKPNEEPASLRLKIPTDT